jgi:hypothetical protein
MNRQNPHNARIQERTALCVGFTSSTTSQQHPAGKTYTAFKLTLVPLVMLLMRQHNYKLIFLKFLFL